MKQKISVKNLEKIKLDSRRNMCSTFQYVSAKEERETMGRREGVKSERKREI